MNWKIFYETKKIILKMSCRVILRYENLTRIDLQMKSFSTTLELTIKLKFSSSETEQSI